MTGENHPPRTVTPQSALGQISKLCLGVDPNSTMGKLQILIEQIREVSAAALESPALASAEQPR